MAILKQFTYYLKLLAELSKVKITVAVSFTTFAGYVLAACNIDNGFLIATAGIFLLACSSSVINQIQERHSDIRMNRTKNRPLPAKKISLGVALLIAGIQGITGGLLLFYSSGIVPLMLGLLAFVWYNGVYTLLKQVTGHAVIPGSLIGSIPPLVGWVTGGGELLSLKALGIAFFFFIWQIPHFYLLMYKYRDQYKEAHFPVITVLYHNILFKRMLFIWICLMILSSFVFPLFEITVSYITITGLGILAVWIFFIYLFSLLRKEENYKAGKYFMRINYYVLGVILFIVTDHMMPF